MSWYFVYVRDEKENKPDVRMTPYYGGYDPPEPVWCADPVQAETRDQAKYLFIKKWTNDLYSSVYHDDWPHLRVRLLGHGDLTHDEQWLRIHEILDHDNKPCDCPYLDEGSDPEAVEAHA